MPLTGTESILSAALEASMEAEIFSSCGFLPISPKCIDGISSGISLAIIPHLVANILVSPLSVPALGLIDSVAGPVTGTATSLSGPIT